MNSAVVEVGLGGRLDSTNVVDAEVCVVTSIGQDHTEYLGEDVFRRGLRRFYEENAHFRLLKTSLFGSEETVAGLVGEAIKGIREWAMNEGRVTHTPALLMRSGGSEEPLLPQVVIGKAGVERLRIDHGGELGPDTPAMC